LFRGPGHRFVDRDVADLQPTVRCEHARQRRPVWT
jgi:hypothetical protein